MKKSNILNILPGVNNLQSFYIAAVNKVEPGTFVKTSSMKHGIANESVVLTEHVSLLTTQSVTLNLVQAGLILSRYHPFLGVSFESMVSIIDKI